MSVVAQTLRAGLQHHRAGDLPRAEQAYRQALQIDPQSANAWCLLGAVCLALGRTSEAVDDFQHALRLQPEYVEACCNLGVALTELGRLSEAAEVLRQALRLRPSYAEALNNLGSVLRDMGELEPAIENFRQAIAIKPDYAEAHNNLGVALTDFGRPEEAVACLATAIRLKPDYATAHMSLANALRDQGALDQAVASYAEALRLAPQYAEAHFNRSLILLIQGEYAEAWPEYEWRWRCKGFPRPPFREALWDGAPLAGRTILVHAEQGLGDTIQFLRFLPQVVERGGRVILRCPEPLVELAARSPGVDQVLNHDEPPPRFDVQVPLLSLARIFGVTLENLPADVPYLFPDPELVSRWKRELAAYDGLKVGIAWQGNPKYGGDRRRSFPLSQLERVARVEGVHLFSLQKGFGAEQVEGLRGRFRVHELTSRAEGLHETAAVVANLDLVISPNTAIAHLAGALGRPTWVALPNLLEWRWLVNREESPWYPTARLFRQQSSDDWNEVFERMAQALHVETSRAQRPPAVAIEVVISASELVDRIAGLRARCRRNDTGPECERLEQELGRLASLRDRTIGQPARLMALENELVALHEASREAQAALRTQVQVGKAGRRLIELARTICADEDRRAAILSEIGELARRSSRPA